MCFKNIFDTNEASENITESYINHCYLKCVKQLLSTIVTSKHCMF